MSGRTQAFALLSVVGAFFLLPAISTSPTGANGAGRERPLTSVAPGCEPGEARQGSGSTYVLGVKTSDSSCDKGTQLMRAYHECLRNGGGEVSCRNDGPQVRRDVANLGRRYATSKTTPVSVGTEAQLRRAWANPLRTAIVLTRDIFLRSCLSGGPIRESQRPMTLDGRGHTIRQTCFEKRILRQDGTGFLVIKNITLTRGGNDGPGAAVTTRGEILVMDSQVLQNLAEEPGGGVFSQRRATIVRSIFTGNLANDDGGAVYARRGGVEVYDSIMSNNLVDGSGGAIGSTGDILVVRSHVDGNTTDGDGGALYTDEDGDVTVIDSTVDGNTADGPGGAIFTLEGDVTIVNSTLNGNRADDRGGAISGEADVTVINSTIARNASVAHVGGGIWARSDLYVVNSTISDNYAEGQGGGVLAAGTVGLVNSSDPGQRGARCRERRGCAAGNVRFDHRAGQDRLLRWPGAADRDELSCGFIGFLRLQPCQRHVMRSRWSRRPDRRRRPLAGAAGRERRVRRDAPAPARQSRGGPDPRQRVPASCRSASHSKASSIWPSSASTRSRRSPRTSAASHGLRRRHATSAP